MSFNDIFKSSFLENVSEFSVLDTVLGLAVSLVIGLFIFLIYKKTLTGVMYSSGFALTLVGLSLVTTLVIMAVTSNVVLSLGMVGALSIIRFRTAIKEPVEIVFLFWSLAVGIVVGAGLLPLAVIGSALIGVILLLFANRKVRNDPYILVLNCTDETAEHAALDVLKKDTEHAIVKSKTPPPTSSTPSSTCPAWGAPPWSATTANTCRNGGRTHACAQTHHEDRCGGHGRCRLPVSLRRRLFRPAHRLGRGQGHCTGI